MLVNSFTVVYISPSLSILSPMGSKLLLLAALCNILLSFHAFQVVASVSRGECLPVNDDKEAFHCFSTKKPIKECEDLNEECDGWARRGECHKNPGFMIKNCRKKCGLCMDLHVGELQVAPDAFTRRAVLDRLVETQDYIYSATEQNPQTFRKCRNGKLSNSD